MTTVRPIRPADLGPVCELVNADALEGQPPCTLEQVAGVVAGTSAAGSWSWEHMTAVRTLVAVSAIGEVVGAGAVGRGADGHPHVLWLHAREDRALIDTLLFNLLRGVRRSAPVYAFEAATDLAVAVEGLPWLHRPETHAALLTRGFTGTPRWLYLCASGPGPAPELPVRVVGRAGELRIETTDGGATIGGADVSLTGPDTGVVWWLEVDRTHRRSGFGRALLRGARQALADAGAGTVVLVVDLGGVAGADRRWALRLYEREGFEVVAELLAYRRGATG